MPVRDLRLREQAQRQPAKPAMERLPALRVLLRLPLLLRLRPMQHQEHMYHGWLWRSVWLRWLLASKEVPIVSSAVAVTTMVVGEANLSL